MEIQEARDNIGAVVELVESTKPYGYIIDGETFTLNNINFQDMFGELTIDYVGEDGDVYIISENEVGETLSAKHLKLIV